MDCTLWQAHSLWRRFIHTSKGIGEHQFDYRYLSFGYTVMTKTKFTVLTIIFEKSVQILNHCFVLRKISWSLWIWNIIDLPPFIMRIDVWACKGLLCLINEVWSLTVLSHKMYVNQYVKSMMMIIMHFAKARSPDYAVPARFLLNSKLLSVNY
jgi:hypothetical protein